LTVNRSSNTLPPDLPLKSACAKGIAVSGNDQVGLHPSEKGGM